MNLVFSKMLPTMQCLAFFILFTTGLQFAYSENKPSGGERNGVTCPFSATATDQQDKQALEDLYYYMGGVAWVKSDGWMKGDPCGDKWFGVCCSESGRVTELRMPSNLVLGQLTSSIASLTELEVLVLYNNSMQGALPPELFSMDKLQIVDLSSNMFTAGIPEKILLPQLTNLTLANNQLQGYLPAKWDTPNLKHILLYRNSFQGSLPSGLSAVDKLVELDVSNNALTGLTGDIGKLKSLEKLSIFSNRFVQEEIPDEWSGLSGLKELNIDGMYGSLPDWIGEGWATISKLTIRYGQISGTFPASFCKFKQINLIDLSNNAITGNIPECICHLPSKTLTTLTLSGNQLIGTIPDCFEELHNLTFVSFSSNKLTGHLPRSLGSLPVLRSIQFSDNDLYGVIPAEYAKLSDSIRSFGINSNKMNAIEDGLEPFFEALGRAGCDAYSNPWTCPLPTYMTTTCFIECSKCNTPDKHVSCSACIADSQCGWCGEGGNCLPGSLTGPKPYTYNCKNKSWIYEFQALCNN